MRLAKSKFPDARRQGVGLVSRRAVTQPSDPSLRQELGARNNGVSASLRRAGQLALAPTLPAAVWAVNITGDGRLVVAAYGDGTIRWHRMSDGAELLAFMPLADRTNWVAWTPEGFYAATAGAQGVLRWQVNRGWEPADSVPSRISPGHIAPPCCRWSSRNSKRPAPSAWP